MAKTYGFDEFVASLGKLEQEFKTKAKVLLEETGNHAVAEVQMRTPVLSGTLRRSITRDSVKDFTVRIGAGPEAPYAIWVEDGSRTNTPRYMFRDGSKVAEVKFKIDADRLYKDITKGFKI